MDQFWIWIVHRSGVDLGILPVSNYNSEIWHLHSLKLNLKQKLLSSSAKAIKTCIKFCTNDQSFVCIHEMYNRATPDKFLLYTHARNLFKLMNGTTYSQEWVSLNFNQILTSRQTTFIATRKPSFSFSKSSLSSKFQLNPMWDSRDSWTNWCFFGPQFWAYRAPAEEKKNWDILFCPIGPKKNLAQSHGRQLR